MHKWYRIFPNLVGIVILLAALFTAQFLPRSHALEALIAKQLTNSALVDNGQTDTYQSIPGCHDTHAEGSVPLADPSVGRMPSSLLILIGSGLIGLVGFRRKVDRREMEK